MKIILISGKAGHGKDTAAEFLKLRLTANKKHVLITHYADLLKYICRDYFNWDGNKDEKGRELLQHIGTDIIRKQNPNFWVDFITQVLGYFYENWDYVIIPDCRFPNEISRVVENGFDTIHLRVKREECKTTLTEEQQKHSSETALDSMTPDYYIDNNGSIEELREKINKWADEVLNTKL